MDRPACLPLAELVFGLLRLEIMRLIPLIFLFTANILAAFLKTIPEDEALDNFGISLSHSLNSDDSYESDSLFDLVGASRVGDLVDIQNALLCYDIPDTLVSEALAEAAFFGELGAMRLLLEDERCDPSWNQSIALYHAVNNGSFEGVKLLLESPRLNIAACNYRAVRLARSHGSHDILSILLLDERVDIYRALNPLESLK